MHRLDRETSGCLLVAKRRAVLRDLHAQLREARDGKALPRAGRRALAVRDQDASICRCKTNLKQGGERVVRVHATGKEAVTTFKPLRAVRQGRDAAGCRSSGPAARTRSACMRRTPATRWPATRNTAIATRMRSSGNTACRACSCTPPRSRFAKARTAVHRDCAAVTGAGVRARAAA